jgi:hypothetical protein
MKKNLFAPIKNIKLRHLHAWLAVPGNQNKTASDYAKALKDRTVIQGEF